MESIMLRTPDGMDLSVAVFSVATPKALVQIIHGATEHKERYYDFISFLNQNGYSVIISDNRGHGHSINKDYPLGYMDNVDQMIEDQVMISKYIQDRNSDKELYLLGHSFGSILARCYLQKNDDRIKKLVLSGTPYFVPYVDLGIFIANIIIAFSGRHGYNPLMAHLGGIEGEDISWISTSKSNIERYRQDPLCGYKYQNASTMTLFKADRQLHQYKRYECKNPGLAILNITGEEDPITGGRRGLKDTLATLEKIGYIDITNIVYQGMKHEVLNEDERNKVYQDVLEFFEK